MDKVRLLIADAEQEADGKTIAYFEDILSRGSVRH